MTQPAQFPMYLPLTSRVLDLRTSLNLGLLHAWHAPNRELPPHTHTQPEALKSSITHPPMASTAQNHQTPCTGLHAHNTPQPPIGIQGVHGVQGVQGLRGSGMQGSPDPPPQRSKHSARPPNQHPPAPTRSPASPLPPSNPSGGWSGQGDQEGWGLSRSASPALQGQLHDRLSLSERQPLMHPHH